MKLEQIGFYTLEDKRAKNSSSTSPLWRNELIITARCNFNCPYCRGTDIDGKNGDMELLEIKKVIDMWAENNVQNVRFSGGEPTIHKDFKEVIRYTKEKCTQIKHIAVSTNGYSSLGYYKELIELGVNDYSISLDACCPSIGDMMAGGVVGSWEVVTKNIKELSKLTYVTVGMVFDKQNTPQMKEAIEFAHSLGVADIRIISASQWNDFSIFENLDLSDEILNAHPILKYRVHNFKDGKNVRGITDIDSHRCGLILDDTIIKGKYHYPCVIKMREGCSPIGEVSADIRQKREMYYKAHDCYKDETCKKNCLDVCVDYNNKHERFKIERTSLTKLHPLDFTYDIWANGNIHDLGIISRYDDITKEKSRQIIKEYAIGWCFGESLYVRPKINHVAVMFEKENERFWFHVRNNEFVEIF